MSKIFYKRIDKFNKEFNECNSYKVENIENMINYLFTKKTDKNIDNSENKIKIIDEKTKLFTSKYLNLGRIFLKLI